MGIVDIDNLLPRLQQPDWVLGNEIGSIHKDWDKTPIKYLFSSPQIYHISSGIPAVQIMYNVINALPDALCERVFLPDKDITKIIRETQHPLWSLESRHEFKDFDIIMLSLYFELQYINVPHILKMGQIPIRRWERGEDDPVVIIGGFTQTNPEPLSDFADIICVGDGENWIEQVHEVYKKHYITYTKTWNTSKEEFLHEVQRDIMGSYVPSFYEVEYDDDNGKITRTKKYDDIPDVILKNRADIWNRPASDIIGTIIPSTGDAGFSRSIEAAKGCTHACRFCKLGFTGMPYRERHPNAITQAIDERLKLGIKEVTFSAPNASEYSDINYLAKYCYNKGMKAIIQSERVDSICDEELNFVRSESGRLQTSIAIEAGTQRMRDAINKECTMDQIKAAIKHIMLNTKYFKLKTMLMMNLPFETDEDTLAIADMIKEIIEYRDELYLEDPIHRKRLFLHYSVSPFIPGAHTPMQWEPITSRPEIYDKLGNKLKGIMSYDFDNGNYEEQGDKIDVNEGLLAEGSGYRKYAKFNILGGDNTREMQVIFGRGDRRIGKIIYEMALWGCDNRMPYGSYKTGYLDKIYEIANKYNIPAKKCVTGFAMDDDLPWDFIDVGVEKRYLYEEFERMKNSEFRETCTKKCSNCGACDFKGEKDGLVFARNEPIHPDYHIERPPKVQEEMYLIEGIKDEKFIGVPNKGVEAIVRSLFYTEDITINKKVRLISGANDNTERISGKFYVEIYIPVNNIPNLDKIKEMFEGYMKVDDIRVFNKTFDKDVTNIKFFVRTDKINQNMIDTLNSAEEIEIRKWTIGERQTRGRQPFNVRESLIKASLVKDGVLFETQMTKGDKSSPFDYIMYMIPSIKEADLWEMNITLLEIEGNLINKKIGGFEEW